MQPQLECAGCWFCLGGMLSVHVRMRYGVARSRETHALGDSSRALSQTIIPLPRSRRTSSAIEKPCATPPCAVYSMVYSELCYSMSCVTVAVKIREKATLENCTNEARLEMPPSAALLGAFG